MQDVDIHSKNKETKGCFMKWNTEWVDLQNMETTLNIKKNQ